MPRVVYTPPSVQFWQHYINQQGSGDLGSFFQGDPYQRGSGIGSIFRSLWRGLAPILKSGAKAVGKQALRSGAQLIGDVARGESFLPALEARGREAVGDLADKAAAAAANIKAQAGSGAMGIIPAAAALKMTVKRLSRKRPKRTKRLKQTGAGRKRGRKRKVRKRKRVKRRDIFG